ncbi:hypothetical protein DL93DRAFT_2167522 [Clavulina sp. PMI_390]|nr:hypothetical protein DL93DRAFT_2167522 [Clavulina sp. PMI_390]
MSQNVVMPQQSSDSSHPTPSDTQSFHGGFPPELASEVISHLSLGDVKSYSLCSSFCHELCISYLWCRVVVSLVPMNGQRLTDFVDFFLHRPAYAKKIKALYIMRLPFHSQNWVGEGPQVGAAYAQGWAGFRKMLAFLSNLKCLRLEDKGGPDQIGDWASLPPFSEEFYSVIARAPFAAWLTDFSFLGPNDRAIECLNAYRNLSFVEIPGFSSFSELPDHTHTLLHRTRASMSQLFELEDLPCLEHWDAHSSQLLLFPVMKMFGDTLRRYRSLLKVHAKIFINENYPLLWEPSPLNSLAHASLQELELFFYSPSFSGAIPNLEVFPSLIPPKFLLAFPALTSIHIALFQGFEDPFISFTGKIAEHDAKFDISQPPDIIDRLKLTLLAALTPDQCPEMLREVRVSIGDADEHRKVGLLQFTARRNGKSGWEVTTWHGWRKREHEFLSLRW